MAQIRMLIEKKNTVLSLPSLVQEDEFEISVEACEGSIESENYEEVEAKKQGRDKLNQIIEILENMGKRIADTTKSVKENTNEDSTESKSMFYLVKQSSTPTPFSYIVNPDNSSIGGEIESIDGEVINKSYLSQTIKVAPQVFDVSSGIENS